MSYTVSTSESFSWSADSHNVDSNDASHGLIDPVYDDFSVWMAQPSNKTNTVKHKKVPSADDFGKIG
jgi:hypothetical protein